MFPRRITSVDAFRRDGCRCKICMCICYRRAVRRVAQYNWLLTAAHGEDIRQIPISRNTICVVFSFQRQRLIVTKRPIINKISFVLPSIGDFNLPWYSSTRCFREERNSHSSFYQSRIECKFVRDVMILARKIRNRLSREVLQQEPSVYRVFLFIKNSILEIRPSFPSTCIACNIDPCISHVTHEH